MSLELPFRTLRPWLIERFGGPTYRVALDAGSSCPNRDGSKGFGGCVYCDVEGSGTGALATGRALTAQLKEGIARISTREDSHGVIAYFQSYSNTYVERARLREVLDSVRPFLGDPVVCVSIATRPDTLPDWAIEELVELSTGSRAGKRVEVWVELGLESASNQVLEDIRRFHTAEEFSETTERCLSAGLECIAHAILGLPGDGREGARETAKLLATSGARGIKVHNLMVLRRTQLEKEWREGRLRVLDSETYIAWLADFVELLSPDQVLHRITGDAPPEERLAPEWSMHTNTVRNLLAAELRRRGTQQGSAYLQASTAQPD